jgi:hypothetical protein
VIQQVVGALEQEGRVSPVDLGISLLALGELARERDLEYLTRGVFVQTGGEEGLLTAYLRDRLERIGEEDRAGVLRAVSQLVEPFTGQRVAEGRKVEELVGAAELPAPRLGAHLSYLASPQVRLLEPLPPPPEPPGAYRLAHERFVAADPPEPRPPSNRPAPPAPPRSPAAEAPKRE